jgi:hypothetical protein
MMNNRDILTGKLSFFGRLVDEITREVIPFKNFKVSILNHRAAPLYKEDGFFAFSDIEQSLTNYKFHLSAPSYQSRIVEKNLPPGLPMELSFDGEDDLYVSIDEVQNSATKRVTFANIPFLKTIPRGTTVIGGSGFSTTLTGTLEGEDIGFADLDNISGFSADEILRFVRSNNIIMQPGPYYSFNPGTTILALKFVDNSTPDKPPLANVKCEIIEVNEVVLDSPTNVGAVAVNTVTLPNPVGKMILGPEKNITTHSDERGTAVFYYLADTPINKLKLEITANGYVPPPPQEVTVIPNQREFQLLELTKI